MNKQENIDRCVICGNYVPEGRMVCPICELGGFKKKHDNVWMSKEQENVGAYLYDRDTGTRKKDRKT